MEPSAARLSWPFGFRPAALRHCLSAMLPFRCSRRCLLVNSIRFARVRQVTPPFAGKPPALRDLRIPFFLLRMPGMEF